MRKRGRTDANQEAIVKALRDARCEVLVLSSVGQGVPDLLVYVPYMRVRRLFLLELKDGDKTASKRKLTPDEERFAEKWPVVMVHSVEDALHFVRGGRMRERL